MNRRSFLLGAAALIPLLHAPCNDTNCLRCQKARQAGLFLELRDPGDGLLAQAARPIDPPVRFSSGRSA